MRTSLIPLVLILSLGAVASSSAQFKDGEVEGPKVGESQVSYWRAGLEIQASGGACRGLAGYVPIPTDWPEQEVKTVEEDISPEAKVQYQLIDGGVQIMSVQIAQIPAGQTVKAVILLEIRRSTILPPENTDAFSLPDERKIPKAIRPYLGPSPKIESRNQKIRDQAKKLVADKEKAWDKVEAIYDWVRKEVKYETGPLKGAVETWKDGAGDCEGMTSLFIALCRAAGIPARTVWVPGHCYPEFYLEDEKGEGHWFPCQIAGSREFGGITELKPILQKGDNFRPPKNSKERQRYMAEYLIGKPTPGGGKPQVKFIREQVAK